MSRFVGFHMCATAAVLFYQVKVELHQLLQMLNIFPNFRTKKNWNETKKETEEIARDEDGTHIYKCAHKI